jgi:spore maturation protein SpmB
MAVVVWGLARGVAVYQQAVEGGREAFDVTLRIVPYLVVMLVATGMLRASGAFDFMLGAIGPAAARLGIPPEAIPMGLMRTLSGSGARGLAVELMRVHGPDSFVGQVVSTIQGSTETTFYVIAVYLGAARVRVTRHALLACLLADAVGVFAAAWACRLYF